MDSVKELLSSVDVLFCQEILLLEEDCFILRNVDEDFNVNFIASRHSTSPTGEGRPIGGLATFYRKNVKVETFIASSNMQVLRILGDGEDTFGINLYMPCDERSAESTTKYSYVLGEVQDILCRLPSSKVILTGDFNADHIVKSTFWSYLHQFIESNDLVMRDCDLPNDTFTFLSSAYNTTRWLDHVISSKTVKVSKISARYDLALYDHFPIQFEVSGIHLRTREIRRDATRENQTPGINWAELMKSGCRKKYNEDIMNIMKDANLCVDQDCRQNHNDQIESYYKKLTNAMKNSSLQFTVQRRAKSNVVPGWNKFCKNKYTKARTAFLRWKSLGKLRSGPVYEEMKELRKEFKNALKYCRKNEQQLRDESIASDLASRRNNSFWKKVKARRGKGSPDADYIDGIHEPQLIAESFAEKFSSVNGVGAFSEEVLNQHPSAGIRNGFLNTDVLKAVQSLKECCGKDGIHSNHLKLLSPTSIIYLKRFYNSCLIHGYFPQSAMNGTIKPRIKNKFGAVNDSKNYREVMLSNNFFKVLEYLLLPEISGKIKMSTCQYAYRENTSTLDAVTILKEVVHKYTSEGSTVYSCFMDLSKAFERVDHVKLLDKLRDNGVSPHIVRLLRYVLLNSFAAVEYLGATSAAWRIKRGVRQGGVLSALLFSIYIEDLLASVSKQEHGCRLGVRKLNIQAYADDVVIFCPTAEGLRKLIEIFHTGCEAHKLVINLEKTKIVEFGKESSSQFFMNGRLLEKVSEYKYLGIILSSCGSIVGDIKRAQGVFNRKVGGFIRQFCCVEFGVKMKLFNTICLPIYGSGLWINRNKSRVALKNIGVSYHLALKKLAGCPKYYSNHYTCNLLHSFTFEHWLNFQVLQFYISLIGRDSSCFLGLGRFLRSSSMLRSNLDKIYFDKYQINDVLENDIDAIISRIFYVQDHEDSSWFFGV